jgi:hypothetical protein
MIMMTFFFRLVTVFINFFIVVWSKSSWEYYIRREDSCLIVQRCSNVNENSTIHFCVLLFFFTQLAVSQRCHEHNMQKINDLSSHI